MDFTYSTTGSIAIGGCSDYIAFAHFVYSFSVGSVVYFKPKAIKGVFEKIVVKSVRFPRAADPTRTAMCNRCDLSPLYVDTMNALYNEDELISYDEALSYVEDFVQVRNAMIERNALLCK